MYYAILKAVVLIVVLCQLSIAQNEFKIDLTKSIQASTKDYVTGEIGFILNRINEGDTLENWDRSGVLITSRIGASGIGGCLGYGLGMWSQHQGLMGIYLHIILDYDWNDFGYSKTGWSLGPGIKVAVASLIINISYSRMLDKNGGYLALSIGLGN